MSSPSHSSADSAQDQPSVTSEKEQLYSVTGRPKRRCTDSRSPVTSTPTKTQGKHKSSFALLAGLNDSDDDMDDDPEHQSVKAKLVRRFSQKESRLVSDDENSNVDSNDEHGQHDMDLSVLDEEGAIISGEETPQGSDHDEIDDDNNDNDDDDNDNNDDNDDDNGADDQQGSSDNNDESDGSGSGSGSRARRLSVGAGSSASARKSRFKCDDCGQTFNNPQALGGHRSQHYRARLAAARNSGESLPKPLRLSAASPTITRSNPTTKRLRGRPLGHFKHIKPRGSFVAGGVVKPKPIVRRHSTPLATRTSSHEDSVAQDNPMSSLPYVCFVLNGKPARRVIKAHGSKLRVQFQANNQYPSLIWDDFAQTAPPRVTGCMRAWNSLNITNIQTFWPTTVPAEIAQALSTVARDSDKHTRSDELEAKIQQLRSDREAVQRSLRKLQNELRASARLVGHLYMRAVDTGICTPGTFTSHTHPPLTFPATPTTPTAKSSIPPRLSAVTIASPADMHSLSPTTPTTPTPNGANGSQETEKSKADRLIKRLVEIAATASLAQQRHKLKLEIVQK